MHIQEFKLFYTFIEKIKTGSCSCCLLETKNNPWYFPEISFAPVVWWTHCITLYTTDLRRVLCSLFRIHSVRKHEGDFKCGGSHFGATRGTRGYPNSGGTGYLFNFHVEKHTVSS